MQLTPGFSRRHSSHKAPLNLHLFGAMGVPLVAGAATSLLT